MNEREPYDDVGTVDAEEINCGLPEDGLDDAVDVAAEGRAIAATGIQYVVPGIVPAYGMLGLQIAYAKVGKTTCVHALGAAVAKGSEFLGRPVERRRVLALRHPLSMRSQLKTPPPVVTWEDHQAALRRIDALEHQLRAQQRKPRDEDDRRVLVALVTAIGGRRFSARECIDHARQIDRELLQ